MPFPLIAAALPLAMSVAGPLLSGLLGGGKDGEGGGGMLGNLLGGLLGGGGSKNGESSSKGDTAPGSKLTGGELAHIIGVSKGRGIPDEGGEPQYAKLPPRQEAALEQLAHQQQDAPRRRHAEQSARATIDRIKNELLPQLQQLREEQRYRATQIEATAEHKNIVARDQFRQRVLARLDRIDRLLNEHHRFAQTQARAQRRRRPAPYYPQVF